MRRLRLAGCVLGLACIVLAPSCGLLDCDDDETERDTACEQVTRAAENAAVTCELARTAVGVLCAVNCISSSKDGRYCRSNEEVAACVQAIQGMACSQFSRAAILVSAPCARLFGRLESDCQAFRSDRDDDDDDD